MAKYPEETKNVSLPPPGRWVWNDESRTVEFVSSYAAEEGVLRKKSQTSGHFNELQRRAAWLAEVYTLNHRGHQSIRKRVNPAHLDAYRSSLTRRRGHHVTIDDVKQVAVSLLQENHLLPIPSGFLDVLKSKGLDGVLTALLLYLSCFFEHKSLENKRASLMVINTITERQMMLETSTKRDIAQRKLAVRYFSLMMDLEREQNPPYHRGQTSANRTEWLLHACLYSFLCYVAWVTFGRKDLRDIQEEVGRLLYSDTFNTAVRNRTDGDSGTTSATVNGSVKTGAADRKETSRTSAFKQSGTSQRRAALSSVVNQRSPLMVSLLPSPKEQSPHLFLGSWARSRTPLQAERCDTEALAEQLDQQLASVSFGILGKPLGQFSHGTLIPRGEEKSNGDEDKDGDEDEPGGDVHDNIADRPGVCAQGSKSSFVTLEATGFGGCGSATLTNTNNSAASIDLAD